MAAAIWIGVALWLGLNLAFAALRLHVSRRFSAMVTPPNLPLQSLPALRLVR